MVDKIDMNHQLWVGFWLGVGATVLVLGFCIMLGLAVGV